MSNFAPGSRGPAVQIIQQRLTEQGFDTDGADGIFGRRTEAAVRAFQEAKDLPVDGIVGPQTATALGLDPSFRNEPADDGTTPLPPFTRQAVLPMFPSAHSADVAAHLPLVLKALIARGLTDRRLVLAALSTIRAETGGFVPLDEFLSRYNSSEAYFAKTGGHPFDLYDNRASLGNGPAPDGASFKGRGFVQLTGRSNYTSIGKEIGQPLVDQPELANAPDTAAAILAAFIKRQESRMLAALEKDDLATARRLVNGGTNGLSAFTAAYNTGRPLLAAPIGARAGIAN